MTSEQRRVYAERVKLLRQAAGMRQEDLAAAAGVSRPTIIGIENGTTVPQQDSLVRILSVLGIDVDEPRFEEQTERWLAMMGSLIEAIPDPHREPAVNAAIRELTVGIRTASLAPASDVSRGGDTSGIDSLGVLTSDEVSREDLGLAADRRGDQTPDPDQGTQEEIDDDDDNARPGA